MNKLYLALPFDITVRLNAYKHTKSIFDKWDNKKIDISGSVKGCIKNDRSSAGLKLVENVRKYIGGIYEVLDGKLKIEDFSFTFMIYEVDDDGDVWTGRGVSSTYNF